MRQTTGKRDSCDVMIREGDIVSYEHGRIKLRGEVVQHKGIWFIDATSNFMFALDNCGSEYLDIVKREEMA